MRAELGLLRDGAPTSSPPIASLSALPDLARRAGARIDVALPTGAAVPEVVGAAAFRIVQEALTNVQRHAGAGATAQVRIARLGEAVEVEVSDDGRGAPAEPRPGGGLTGMRERAAALGGSVDAARTELGGFRVHALLPLEGLDGP